MKRVASFAWSYLAILQACYFVLRPVTGTGSVIIPPDPNMYMNMYIISLYPIGFRTFYQGKALRQHELYKSPVVARCFMVE